MAEFTRGGLESAGFQGFVRFTELDNARVPVTGGVYAVLREAQTIPVFLEASPGGRFKQKDPTVETERLAARWIASCPVIYIGKATNLSARLKQYRDFGSGRPVGHWGGRFIWQIEGASDHIVGWKSTDENPRSAEIDLLTRFRSLHGRLPFRQHQLVARYELSSGINESERHSNAQLSSTWPGEPVRPSATAASTAASARLGLFTNRAARLQPSERSSASIPAPSGEPSNARAYHCANRGIAYNREVAQRTLTLHACPDLLGHDP